MKNIIIKTVLTLLLIIEFYPIEANSQTLSGQLNFQNDYAKEIPGENFTALNTGPVNIQDHLDLRFNICYISEVQNDFNDVGESLSEALLNEALRRRMKWIVNSMKQSPEPVEDALKHLARCYL